MLADMELIWISRYHAKCLSTIFAGAKMSALQLVAVTAHDHSMRTLQAACYSVSVRDTDIPLHPALPS